VRVSLDNTRLVLPDLISVPPPEDITFPLRQRQLLEMSSLGFSVNHMADTLELTPAHVNTLINALCRKCQVSRSELPLFGVQNTSATKKGGRCKPGLHPQQCPCDEPLCWGRRRVAA
jgi:DNA-binding NarL/FixJ family response regulator